ncbi:MAG: IS1595 family transposase [Pirellulaceae bacterium]
MTDTPKTLLEAVRYFSSLKVCFEAMLAVKWPEGNPACPKCGECNVGVITSRSMLQCKAKACRKQFSVKVGTIFEDSPLGLDKWFVAVWCIANMKNGISSHELARALGVTQKTAWFMLHRVRLAMKTPAYRKLNGEVEGDETFVGGKAANMHKHKREKKIKGRGASGKAIVQGLLERGQGDNISQVRAMVVPGTDDESLQVTVLKNVEPESHFYTDAAPSYAALAGRYFHQSVDHLTKYVRGRVHVNGMENFWCLLKRAIKGTYVSVAPFHLDAYVDEESWRFNFRDLTDGLRFFRVLACVVGRRVTYRQLTAQDDAGFMGIK